MAVDTKISDLTLIDAVADADELPIVDKSDATSGASGTTKRTTTALIRSQVMADVDAIQFDVAAAPAHSEGQIHWDGDDKTLLINTDAAGVSINVGQEEVLRARNITGLTITNGTVVYVSGASGQRPTIAPADAASAANANRVMAVATHDIANNSNGYVTTFGLVRDLDTSAYSAGDELYLTDSPGVLATTPGSYRVRVGTVTVSNAATGVILVHISRELLSPGDIGDVQGTQTLTTATDTITAAYDYVEISTVVSGGLVLTSTPSIAAPTGGRRFMVLYNSGAEPIEVQDGGALVGSGVNLGQTTGVIKSTDFVVLYWDEGSSAWGLISHPNQPTGVPTRIEARNASGGTIATGTPVTTDGWNAGQDRTEIIPADAAGSGGTTASIGLTDGSVGNNQNVTVVTFGPITGLNTSAWSEGDVLYLASGGGLTSTRPTGADNIQGHALVLRSSPSSGVLFVYNSGRYAGVPNEGRLRPTVVSVTGTTKTLALSDANSQQHCTNAAAQTITIPAAASVAYTPGDVIWFIQIGAGAVTIQGDTGVSVNGTSAGSVAISSQYGQATAVNIGADSWSVLTGSP